MTIVNPECYVSIEVAKLLKKAGFDWKCRGIYVLDSENDPEYVFSTANFTNTLKEIEGYIRFSAPTLEIAQRWLREVKGYELWVYPFSTHYRFSFYGYLANEDNNTNFDTYEEALEACIKKALEIILEEKE